MDTLPATRRPLTALAAILAAALVLGSTAPARALDAPPGYVAVPLTVMAQGNQAVVSVTINGRRARLILDTGASHTTLDRSFFQGVRSNDAQSQLPAGQLGKVKINGQEAEVGMLSSLNAGGLELGGGPVVVIDLSRSFGQYNSRYSTEAVQGLLGQDAMRRRGVIINWATHVAYFNANPSKRLKMDAVLARAGWTAVPMSSASGQLQTVACTVENKAVHMLVDTGSTFTTCEAGIVKLPILQSRDTGRSIGHIDNTSRMTMSMIGMDSNAYPAVMENWKIGTYPVARTIVVVNQHAGGLRDIKTPGSGPVLGLLGAATLASHRAIIDVNAGTLFLKPPATTTSAPRKR